MAGGHPGLLTMIAPRHPARGPEIAELARERGLGAALRSRNEPVAAGTDILVADTIGELGLFFSLSEVAVVGGSLAPNGGHNPVEAALLGCAILHGPHMENFRAIESELRAAGAAALVRTAEDIAREAGSLMTDAALRARRIDAARRLAMDKRHVLDAVFSHLDGALDGIAADPVGPRPGRCRRLNSGSGDGYLPRLLSPAGALWSAGAAIRRAWTSPASAGAPVICVGNAVAGGAGKTPVAMAVGAALAARDAAPHFLSRGYGGSLAGPVRVDRSRHGFRDVGDEPLLLDGVAPAWVARRPAGRRAGRRRGRRRHPGDG